MFIKFYLLTSLRGHKPNSARIMKTIQIKQLFCLVRRKMGSTRYLSAYFSVRNSANEYHGRIELDSHSETTVLGCNCVILAYTGKECTVSPYNYEYDSIQQIPVVTGATAWSSPHSGKTFIQVFNKVLWMGDKSDHTLVNPNQIHHHRIDVQDNPCMHKPMAIVFL